MSSPSPDFVQVMAPNRPIIDKPSVILYGSIIKEGWQANVASSLADLPVAVLNPLRSDWDSSWVEDISFPKFKEQVDWEMDHGKVADVIAFYFHPTQLNLVLMLELGLHAGNGKAVVCCPNGFLKRGNVQMVCARYGLPLLETLDELKSEVRRRLTEEIRKRKLA
jgi:hypothetical protein